MLRSNLNFVAVPVVLAICARAETPEPPADRQAVLVGGLSYSAITRQLETFPVTLQTTATVANRTDRQQQVTFPDGCVVLLRVYREPARAGQPVWDQRRVAICTMAIQTVTFAPGQARQYHTSASASEILGDSLPPGRYYFTALLRPDGGAVEVPAGEAQLER